MSEFEQRLARLQQKFIASIAGRLDNLERAVCDGDVAAARREAHNLKGTAASLEVMQVVEPMSVIELRLDTHLTAGTEPSADEWSVVREQIERVRAVV